MSLPFKRQFGVADFKNLKVWQKAHALALGTHRVAGRIRRSQHASLRNQMIRAAMSVPANIVEGRSQQSEREFARFLRIALNSTTELEYHLLTARDVGAIRESDSLTLTSQVIEVRRMLYGLLRHLASRSEKTSGTPTKATEPV
jgi:four helix bundle protein